MAWRIKEVITEYGDGVGSKMEVYGTSVTDSIVITTSTGTIVMSINQAKQFVEAVIDSGAVTIEELK